MLHRPHRPLAASFTEHGVVAPGQRRPRGRRRSRGQALVEFAFVFPIFVLLFFSVIEFSFAFDALLWLNSASRDASLLGAEAGNNAGADCVILMSIEGKQDPGEKVVTGSANPANITKVVIFKAGKTGQPLGPQNIYDRAVGNSMTCLDSGNNSVTIPYALRGGIEGYVQTSRCNELAGCGAGGSVGVDTLGVEITYQYHWVTPFPTILPWSGPAYTLVKSNVMRMEPIL